MDHTIVFDQVSYHYNANTPFEVAALFDVNLTIPAHQVTAVIGHTGSGKSTLIQHLNVLIKPTKGSVRLGDVLVTSTAKLPSLKPLRKQVGVVFQFPEAQLFEETVLKDVMFGPLNFGVSEEEALAIAKEKLALVGISPDLYERSPFDLSGGQMRRVAIAGVLALEPQVLVLDEPTAGLDPLGQAQMLDMFMRLQKEDKLTLVLISHQMDDVARYADHVIVMEGGTVAKTGTPEQVFSQTDWLRQRRLDVPRSMQFLEKLQERLGDQALAIDQAPLTVEALADLLMAHLPAKEGTGYVG